MARRCDISGKQTGTGNRISHSHRKTKRRFLVNVVTRTVFLPDENRYVRVKMSARMMRTLKNKGVKALMKKYGADPAILKNAKTEKSPVKAEKKAG